MPQVSVVASDRGVLSTFWFLSEHSVSWHFSFPYLFCRWALLSALHPVEENAHRISHYLPYAQDLDFSGVDFPASLADIDKVGFRSWCFVGDRFNVCLVSMPLAHFILNHRFSSSSFPCFP